jgi:CDGSH-type Zn-finger protein
MEEPKIAGKAPFVDHMNKGVYSWCACGQSAKQPYCDGTHKALSSIRSVKFEITEDKTVYLCMCKKSGNKPFCDGTHKTL